MSDILDQHLSLVLNASWQVIGTRTIRQAITSLCSESGGQPPALALDMALDENGQLEYANPTTWDDWLNLEVRPDDLFIQTVKQRIRAPLIIIARHFNKMPMKKPRLSAGAIYERDGGVCQYSGLKLPRSQLNVDHVVPRDRGGRDEWGNMVLSSAEINSRKGNRLNSEVGLTLIRQPKAPPSVPVAATITQVRHPAWKPFLII